MIKAFKESFIRDFTRTYNLVDDACRGNAEFSIADNISRHIRNFMVSGQYIGMLTGHSEFGKDILLYQRILNICQALVQTQDMVHYYESSAYQNRKGALRGALYVETILRKELTLRQKKFPYQLQKSFHTERKESFIRAVETLPETLMDSSSVLKETLNYLIPLVFVQSIDMEKINMKLSGEIIPDFLNLNSFIHMMKSVSEEWNQAEAMIIKGGQCLRQLYSLDQNFSQVKKVLLEEREKTISLLKNPVYSQYEQLSDWDEILEMLGSRNDKGLIKLVTQIIRDRKETVDEFSSVCKEIVVNKVWQQYYELSKICLVTSVEKNNK